MQITIQEIWHGQSKKYFHSDIFHVAWTNMKEEIQFKKISIEVLSIISFISLHLIFISCFFGCLCTRFQANFKELYFDAVKCIVRYVTSTPLMGI